MTIRRKLDRVEYEKKPWLAWNAFVYLLAEENYEDLTPLQQSASLAFWYDSELQNGGHFQYFENIGTARATEVAAALESVGARQQRKVFLEALEKWNSVPRERMKNAKQYSKAALDGEFDRFDRAYSDCVPSIQKCLEDVLDSSFAEFIDLQ